MAGIFQDDDIKPPSNARNSRKPLTIISGNTPLHQKTHANLIEKPVVKTNLLVDERILHHESCICCAISDYRHRNNLFMRPFSKICDSVHKNNKYFAVLGLTIALVLALGNLRSTPQGTNPQIVTSDYRNLNSIGDVSGSDDSITVKDHGINLDEDIGMEHPKIHEINLPLGYLREVPRNYSQSSANRNLSEGDETSTGDESGQNLTEYSQITTPASINDHELLDLTDIENEEDTSIEQAAVNHSSSPSSGPADDDAPGRLQEDHMPMYPWEAAVISGPIKLYLNINEVILIYLNPDFACVSVTTVHGGAVAPHLRLKISFAWSF